MDESVVRHFLLDANAREILLYSALLLEREGWCQYTARDDLGRRCAFGAVFSATVGLGLSRTGAQREAWNRLEGYIARSRAWYKRLLPFRGGIAWNDARGRRPSEVIDALRAAAA